MLPPSHTEALAQVKPVRNVGPAHSIRPLALRCARTRARTHAPDTLVRSGRRAHRTRAFGHHEVIHRYEAHVSSSRLEDVASARWGLLVCGDIHWRARARGASEATTGSA